MKACKTIVALVFTLAISSAWAQEPADPPAPATAEPSASHLQAAEDLMGQLQIKDLLDQSIESNLRGQLQQNPQLADYEDILRFYFTKHMSWDALKGNMAKLYAESFTEAELRELIAFYKTPTGKKAVILPSLVERGTLVGQKRFREDIPALQEAMAKRQAELDAKKEKPAEKPDGGNH